MWCHSLKNLFLEKNLTSTTIFSYLSLIKVIVLHNILLKYKQYKEVDILLMYGYFKTRMQRLLMGVLESHVPLQHYTPPILTHKI